MKIEMEKFPNQMVGQIAVEYPQFIRIFESFKIDYCCGGRRILSDACLLSGVSMEEVMGALKRSGEETKFSSTLTEDWAKMPTPELIDHLLKVHHVFTRSEFKLLISLGEKVPKAHGMNHPSLIRVKEMIDLMSEEMEGHMAKEEEQVFPYLLEVERRGGDKREISDPFTGSHLDVHPLKVLMWEHGMTGEEWIEIHQLTDDFTIPADACESFKAFYKELRNLERDLHTHVHLENNILFDRAIRNQWLD